MLVIGDKEAESQTVNVRLRDGQTLSDIPVGQLIDRLKAEIEQRLDHQHAENKSEAQ